MSQRSTDTTALVTHGAASSMPAPAASAANVPGKVVTRKVPAPARPKGVKTGTGPRRTPWAWLRIRPHQKG